MIWVAHHRHHPCARNVRLNMRLKGQLFECLVLTSKKVANSSSYHFQCILAMSSTRRSLSQLRIRPEAGVPRRGEVVPRRGADIDIVVKYPGVYHLLRPPGTYRVEHNTVPSLLRYDWIGSIHACGRPRFVRTRNSEDQASG